VALFAANLAFGYSGGTGEPNNPYQIANVADLLQLAGDTDNYDKCFIMTADIDLDPCLPGNQIFTTAIIAPTGPSFTGNFDGAGHKVINMTMDYNEGFCGLFGYIYGAQIKHLGVANVNIYDAVGGGALAGYNHYGDINNCWSSGSIIGRHSQPSALGGICGTNEEGIISNCYATIYISGGKMSRALGGIAADNSGTINKSHSNGNIYTAGGDTNIPGAWSGEIGGLVGANGGVITESWSTCNVVGGVFSVELGGLAGGNYGYGIISKCYSTGTISAIGNLSHTLGGLVGDNSGSIEECYSTGNVTGIGSVSILGGLVGSGDHINNCYSTGSVIGGDGSSWIGGLAGQGFNIINCYSTGVVAGGAGSQNIGGLIGDGSNITSSYFLDTSGPDNGYGEPLSDPNMKHQASFVGWDFTGETINGTDDIWWINEGFDYPKLVWQIFNTGNGVGSGSYADWVSVGSPQCWLGQFGNPQWNYQCYGDADNQYEGALTKYRVLQSDYTKLMSAWGKKYTQLKYDPNLICADSDHKYEGALTKYRVLTSDYARMITSWAKKATQLGPVCPLP